MFVPNNPNPRRALRRSAFTLMEMMVVVAIIVALAGMSILYYAGQVDEGNKAKAKAAIASLDSAVNTYYANHSGQWPAGLEVLFQGPDDSGHGPYLSNREALITPWGGQYQYAQNGPGNAGLKPDIWCDMPKGGRITNWSSKTNQ